MTSKEPVGVRAAKIESDGQIRAAKIGGAAVVVAALIALIGPPILHVIQSALSTRHLLEPSERERSQRILERDTDQSVYGRYSMSGLNSASVQPSEEIELVLYGNVDKTIGVAIASPAGKTLIVEEFYMRLESFARCPLRNENTAVEAMGRVIGKSFYVSPDFDRYPIELLDEELNAQSIFFQGREVMNFDFALQFEPYTLLNVTFNVRYKEVGSRRDSPSLATSKTATLMTVENGNIGGCLDIASWWKPEMNATPNERDYDDGIPNDFYVFLTEDYRARLDREKYTAAFLEKLDAATSGFRDRIDVDPVFQENLFKAGLD